MKIREAKIEDVDKIVSILEQVSKMHYENREDIFKKKSKEELKKDTIESINNTEKNVIVATSETSEIYGVLIYKIKQVEGHINLKNSKILWIDELGVDEQYRKRGIGNQLMKKAEEIARKLKCQRIELNCWDFNENAIDFYEGFGMKLQRRIMEKINKICE